MLAGFRGVEGPESMSIGIIHHHMMSLVHIFILEIQAPLNSNLGCHTDAAKGPTAPSFCHCLS